MLAPRMCCELRGEVHRRREVRVEADGEQADESDQLAAGGASTAQRAEPTLHQRRLVAGDQAGARSVRPAYGATKCCITSGSALMAAISSTSASRHQHSAEPRRAELHQARSRRSACQHGQDPAGLLGKGVELSSGIGKEIPRQGLSLERSLPLRFCSMFASVCRQPPGRRRTARRRRRSRFAPAMTKSTMRRSSSSHGPRQGSKRNCAGCCPEWDGRRLWASNGSKAPGARLARETRMPQPKAKRLVSPSQPLDLDAPNGGGVSARRDRR